jgi:hypothetical protein
MALEWYAEVDRFLCSDGSDEAVTIVVRQQLVERDTGGPFHIVHGRPEYTTVDGRDVERLNLRTFRIAGSRTLLKRQR